MLWDKQSQREGRVSLGVAVSETHCLSAIDRVGQHRMVRPSHPLPDSLGLSLLLLAECRKLPSGSQRWAQGWFYHSYFQIRLGNMFLCVSVSVADVLPRLQSSSELQAVVILHGHTQTHRHTGSSAATETLTFAVYSTADRHLQELEQTSAQLRASVWP